MIHVAQIIYMYIYIMFVQQSKYIYVYQNESTWESKTTKKLSIISEQSQMIYNGGAIKKNHFLNADVNWTKIGQIVQEVKKTIRS